MRGFRAGGTGTGSATFNGFNDDGDINISLRSPTGSMMFSLVIKYCINANTDRWLLFKVV